MPEGNRVPLIETSGLTKRYGRVTALDGLTLDVDPGIIGLVGPNGAGKSTLIKILLGLVDATSGAADVLGIDAAREGLRVREIVGYMPEHDCLPPDQSATNFVIHMARMSGIPPSAARERASEVLRHVGLFEERYRHMGGYSTGMKQRVKLAQALAHDPQLLFLDEPTNGLDPQGRDEMLDLVERTGNEFGISIIMSSHLLSEIERVCDGLIVIDEGKLTRMGRIADLTDETAVLAVEVEWDADRLAAMLTERGLEVQVLGRELEIAGGGSADVHDAILDAVVTLNLPLVRLERRRRTLEELFSAGADAAGEASNGAG